MSALRPRRPRRSVVTPWGDGFATRLIAPVLVLMGSAAAASAALGLARDTGLQLRDLIPLALLVGLALVLLALANLEAFVLVVLVSRASLDALKGSSAGAGADPAAALAVLFTIVVTLWLIVQYREDQERPVWSSLDKALPLFIAAALVGVVVSSDRSVSAVEWARMASTVPMLLVVERLSRNRTSIPRVLAAVFAASAVPLLVAGYQYVTGSNVFVAGGFDRLRGTFTHSNPFSVFLTVLLIMAVAVLPHVRRAPRVGLLVFGAAALPALLGTYTRGSWIALAVGLAVVGLLQSKRMLVGLVVALVAVLLTVPSFGERFADLRESTQENGAPANSLSWRLDYWTDALGLAEQSPIAGIGLKAVASSTEEGKQPHNDFIRAYVELGLLGLAAYTALLVALARTAVAGVRATAGRRRDALGRGIAVGFAGVVTAFVFLSFVSNIFSQVVLLWYVLALAGLTVGVTRLPDRGQAEVVADAHPARQ